jgi:AcrR family transcriptional regulator
MTKARRERQRAAILSAATQLFTENGYAQTTMGEIARKSGMAQGNTYHYFDSKFEIFIAIFQPWFESKLDTLERRLKRIRTRRARLRAILFALWRDIPQADNGFHNNLMQALATKKPEERYSRAHLHQMEARVASLIQPMLPSGRRNILDDNLFPHLAFMASDGFTIGHKLVGRSRRISRIVDMTCELLLSEPARKSRSAPTARKSRRLTAS